jgi:dynein heavy chain 1
VENLPQIESPEWSGLPNNAEKLLRELESERFISELNKIQGLEDEELTSTSSSEKASKTWMQIVKDKVERLYSTLPGQVNTMEKMEKYSNSPIFRFLKREIGVMGKLLKKVRNDLISIKEMCEGKSKSTNEIREISKEILNDAIPKSWRVYLTVDMGISDWVVDLSNRVSQLNKVGEDKNFGKNNLWLGGLIFPEAFLISTRQYVAQAQKVPLDELVLNLILPKEIPEKVEDSDFVVSGLFIEGAEWNYDTGKLVMTDNLSSQLPKAILRWVVKSRLDSKIFALPVYLNTTRKNLLFSVMVQNDSDLSDADWYQRGTAIVSWNKSFEYKN